MGLGLLEGKYGLIMGVANDRSIAWGIALLTSLWPQVRYAWVTGGLSLWH